MIKKISLLLIALLIAFFAAVKYTWANYELEEINLQNTHTKTLSPQFKKEKGMLVGGVAVTGDLPQEFYGTWTVVSMLVETNNPELFRMRSSDIWTFERTGDVITLSNPINGASASITVKEVKGKTATFTRVSEDETSYEIETPKITVEGDSFYGTDQIIIEHFKNGKRIKTDRVKYKVKGHKISGPTLKDIFAN